MSYSVAKTVQAAWREPSLLSALKLEDLDSELIVSAIGAYAQTSADPPPFFSHFAALELKGHPQLSPYRQVFDSVDFKSVTKTLRSVALNCYKVFLRRPKYVELRLDLSQKVQLVSHLTKMTPSQSLATALIEKYADELVRDEAFVSPIEAATLLINLPLANDALAVGALAEMCVAAVVNNTSAIPTEYWIQLKELPETSIVRALAELKLKESG